MIKKNNLNSQQEIENNLDLVKNYLNTKNLDYFDVRLEKNKTNKIIIENKNTKTISNIETIGIGIRIIKNKKMGFCSTNNISNYKKIIDDCIENTKKISVKTNFDHEAENNKKIKYKHESFDKKEISRKVLELQKINNDFLSKKSAFK
ncbi:MAG: DNA gyrase modulator, partial [Candidatus ainarchaeum sp.]|nr:DNA gyrase modulator [Candidatus ainarchaeum sp.]